MSLKLSALLNPTSGDNDHDHDDIHNNTSAATSRSHPSSNPADHQRLEAHATPLATIPLSSSPLDPSRLALAHEHAFAPAPSASSPTDTSLFHAHGSPVLPRGHSRTHSSSSLRSLAAPVEPTAQLEHPQPSHSPTLDQYHHGSGSPEYRRRHSFASYRISPPPRLAPIKSLSRSNSSENNSFAPSPQQPTIPSEPNFKPTTMDGDASTHDTIEGVQFENSADQSSQDIPMTPQIPQASTPQTAPETKALSPPLPNIKTEPSATPHESSPGLPATRESPRETTSAQADDTAKEETNGKAGAREESTPSRSSPAAPKQAGRKPTNSKSSAAVTKKGTAAVRKPASKKRKLNLSGTPSSKRSMTPASTSRGKGRKASHTPSAADVSDEDDGSQIDFDDAESSASGTEVYCICRRPDNHTWMIACDGGCDDWFHGKCVHIKEEDGDLIDRYVCPNCEEGGKGRTTWRPMCRLEGCRKPARVNGKSPSKYCTDDHGREFMRRMATGGNRAHESDHTKMKKRKKRTEEEEDEDYEESRGGVLKAREVATLARSVKDHTEFRQLGEGVLSPPPSNDEDGDVKMKVDADDEDYDSLAEADKARLREIRTKRAHLTARKHLLKDKERLFIMIRDRSKNIIEEMDSTGGTGGSKTSKSGGASSKDLCGFDPRVSWSDEELQQFRTSPEGVLAIRNGQIGSPTATDRQNSVSGTLDADEEIRGICLKRRCERHRQWRNILTMSLKMEQREVEEDARVLRDEEEDIRARGELRKVLGDTDGEGGTVEVVAA